MVAWVAGDGQVGGSLDSNVSIEAAVETLGRRVEAGRQQRRGRGRGGGGRRAGGCGRHGAAAGHSCVGVRCVMLVRLRPHATIS